MRHVVKAKFRVVDVFGVLAADSTAPTRFYQRVEVVWRYRSRAPSNLGLCEIKSCIHVVSRRMGCSVWTCLPPRKT